MPKPRAPPDRRPLVERVRPATLSEMQGQEEAIAELRRWADGWSVPGRAPARRAAVFEGPPGVGKTTAALAIARDRGWTIVEMNASDARNEAAIEEVAGRASLSMTLGDTGSFRRTDQGGRALILLDEADCLSGRRTDEGAAPKPARETLRDFLRTRYGTVQELAKAWKLGEADRPKPFEAWSELPASAGRAAWTRLPEAQRDLDDWRGAARPRDRSDRGGLGAIAALVQSTRQPVILTVNDREPLMRYSAVFRNQVAWIRFGPVPPDSLRALLSRVVASEGWDVAPEAMEAILRRARGDARAALNDLEAVHPLPPGPLQLAPFAVRDRTEELRELTEEVLGEGRLYRASEIRDRGDSDPEELLPWIEENVPRFAPSRAALDPAFAILARADLQLARARRQRAFSLWSYASELMTGGIGIALADAGGAAASRAQFPQFLSEMGRSRGRRAIRDSVAKKSGDRFHASVRISRAEFLPFLERWLTPRGRKAALAGAADRSARLSEELGLTAEELAFLTGGEAPPPEPPKPEPPSVAPPPEPPSAPAPAPERAETRPKQRRLGDFGG